ncbi:hypothetical protein LI328DRAFT_161130 [Trichoderma asperelloides]|nr:hypothetical protein LI328DRAFT_161130 [Trichoderma asperelloides]
MTTTNGTNGFDEWATRTPNSIAVEWRGEQLTYSELRTASFRVARALLAAGVRPYDKVAVLTDMSLEMLPSVLGVLRTGAAYVPIDVAAWSRSRIEATLFELSSPFAIVTTPVPGLQLPISTVNFQKQWLRSPLGNAAELIAQLDALRSEFKDDLLSWIIFTSGTTGKPKGVMVYHRAIYALAISFNHSDYLEAALGKDIRVMLAFSVAFDACAAVVWSTLTKGRAVVMASSSSFPDWVNPNRKVFNTYGPTESTCVISLGEIDPAKEPPFGEIVAGAKIVLVDDKLEECNQGEVLIGGPNLAAGYFNNPTLTAAKFIQWNGERWYRTGDLAQRTEDGDFVWAGRTDSLVKNRGFLINIETEVGPALLSFPAPASVDVDELRAFLKERYDPFVIPDDIVALDSFPLTVNSKIDKRALLAQRDEEFSQDDEGLEEDGKEISGHDALRLAFSKTLHVAIKKLDDVSVGEAEFEATIIAEEEKAFQAMKDVSLVDVEVPYFDVTAISIPERKDIAFVTRAHHVLGDVFSTAILFRDVERALAGEQVPQGTQWADFARFMESYKQENLPRAISTFERILGPLPSTSVLHLPKPQNPPQAENYDLKILNSPCAFTKSALDAAARARGITATTMVYAAWALFLSKTTGWDRVGFSISLSGRTVPWPPAQAVVGPVVGKSPFSTAVPAQKNVHDWLSEVHKTTLDIMEFDGVTSSLPETMLANPTTNSTNKHNYLMDWYLFPQGDGLKTEFEFNFAKIDEGWAREAAKIPGRMLEGLVNAGEKTLVGDLLR